MIYHSVIGDIVSITVIELMAGVKIEPCGNVATGSVKGDIHDRCRYPDNIHHFFYSILAIDSDLQKFLFTFTKPFYATAYRAAILGDRGRDVLVSSYVPHLVRDLFGKVRSADLTVVTDDDNSSHDELFGAYSRTITSSLLSRGMADTTTSTDPSRGNGRPLLRA